MSKANVLRRLFALNTNTVSDALDFLELQGATFGIRPLWDCPKIVGRASTVKVGAKTDAAPTTHLITPVIEAVTTDDRILVIAGGKEASPAGATSSPPPPKGGGSGAPSLTA